MPAIVDRHESNGKVDWLDEEENDQHFLYEMESMLPGQIMRLLWNGFTSAIDLAQETHRYDDIHYAACNYSALVEAANRLPQNQCNFWVGRADNHLPLLWMVWMR